MNRMQRTTLLLLAAQAAHGASESTQDSVRHEDSLQFQRIPLPATRAERFPTVEERVRLYMSNWYTPPCEDYAAGKIQYRYVPSADSGEEWKDVIVTGMSDRDDINASNVLTIQNNVEPDMLIFVERETTFACAKIPFPYAPPEAASHQVAKKRQQHLLDQRVLMQPNMRMYCYDAVDSLLPALNNVQWEQHQYYDYEPAHDLAMPPLILQYGDNPTSHVFKNVNIPHIKKFRSAAASPTAIDDVIVDNDDAQCYASPRRVLHNAHSHLRTKFEPILWKFATHRHFRLIAHIAALDTPWHDKKDVAIFRGELTGAKGNYEKRRSDVDNCNRMIRCRLAYKFANSKYVDAKLTSMRKRLPPVINGRTLQSGKIALQQMLKYKGIVMIEGNDVASGLKWALLSQSVVLMPTPRHTSWAMEELLQPWVHYVPLDDDAMNLEERMKWVVENDEKAQEIAQRGALWMEDLVYHPDAAHEDRIIQTEILRRYFAHFVESKIGKVAEE